MEYPPDPSATLLAVVPFYRGFGFAVFEPVIGLVDWGYVRPSTKDDRAFLGRVKSIVERYRVSHVALERRPASPNGDRTRLRNEVLFKFMAKLGRVTVPIATAQLRDEIVRHGDVNRVAIALANEMPELAPHIPRQRRPWESTDERVHLFAAVSLGIAASKQLGWRAE